MKLPHLTWKTLMNLNIPDLLLTAEALEQGELAIHRELDYIEANGLDEATHGDDTDYPKRLRKYHAELRRLRIEIESQGSNIQRLADYERAAALLHKHGYDTEHLQQEISYLRSST